MGHCQLRGRPVLQCNRCKHQASLTAGTLFARTHLPLRTWFLAIYLLTQHKNGISTLLPGCHRCRLHARAAGHRWRSGQRGASDVPAGQHRARQRQEYPARHLPRLDAKYLQRYLSEFCYRFNRRFKLQDLVPWLLYAAAHTPPLPYRLLTTDGLTG